MIYGCCGFRDQMVLCAVEGAARKRNAVDWFLAVILSRPLWNMIRNILNFQRKKFVWKLAHFSRIMCQIRHHRKLAKKTPLVCAPVHLTSTRLHCRHFEFNGNSQISWKSWQPFHRQNQHCASKSYRMQNDLQTCHLEVYILDKSLEKFLFI